MVTVKDKTTRDYEIWEAYALEHLECRDCEVMLAKIHPGEYYCPSCGWQCSE